ncbi:MAG TPA: hypothetical protein VI248_00150 [Kineosporiaceae bacterium]
MTNPAYSFLPWLRHGIATAITAADHDAAVKTRAAVDVKVTVSGDRVGGGTPLSADVSQRVSLYGPGDIIGIDPRAVVRTDPHPWITNYEGNYLAAIEFYDPDFPWRYTPAAPDGNGLRPWVTLIVLREDEFEEVRSVSGAPLPSVTVKNLAVLPNPGELWAWAHVHVNEQLPTHETEVVSTDAAVVAQRLQAAVTANRDLAYARVLCPRRLDDDTGYHALPIPTFESGRLAGLGLKSLAPFATASAWGDDYMGREAGGQFPVYYRWEFRTGGHGDFEYLVSLLKPRPVDPRVGIREFSMGDPGSNLPPITDPAHGAILRLGGALQVPDGDLDADQLAARQRDETWDTPYPVPFQTALAAFVNLPDDYAAADAATANAAAGLGPGVDDDPDPLITAPLYGCWHALTQRLLRQRDGTPAPHPQNWVHGLNLDPRFRIPAAFGAESVEDNRETYLDYAWQQIGDVLAANSRIRHLQLAVGTSLSWYGRHVTPLTTVAPERALQILGPVAGRLLTDGVTLRHLQSTSLVPPVYTSAALRRAVRPGGRTMRTLPFGTGSGAGGNPAATPVNLLARVNSGEVSAAAPLAVPAGLATVDQAAAGAADPGVPGWAAQLAERAPWLSGALSWMLAGLLVLAVVLAIVLGIALSAAVAAAVVAAVVALAVAALGLRSMLRRAERSNDRVDSLREENQTPDSVAHLPSVSDFRLAEPGSTFRPTHAGPDNAVAARYKAALKDSYVLAATTRAVNTRPDPVRLDLGRLVPTVVAGVDPARTIPARGLSAVSLPSWIADLLAAAPEYSLDEVMAYPKIDTPMYLPLKERSVERFLPNINLIPPDSITLVETNQRFIESYMVGLNHEFARKLLWHGYPTDQRGTYFRQFWSVDSYIDSEGLSEDPLKEKLYDIPEIHRWPGTSVLGAHDHRLPPGTPPTAQAVLVIRGELLKKYPNTVVYAHHAKWAMSGGHVDPNQRRDFDDFEAGDLKDPPLDKVRGPLYEAKADPDIYFFGFDLTVEQARGGAGTKDTDDAGWFFVLKERPGEPRFGLEADRIHDPDTFNDVTWQEAMPTSAPGKNLAAHGLDGFALTSLPPSPQPGHLDQHREDGYAAATPTSSARWAYELFRAPILVAVHAEKMLRSRKP